MVEKISELKPPRGFSRMMYRLPIQLYRAGLGWLLGGRFVLLTHIGRKSGQPRKVTLEVVNHDPKSDTYYIASGFGEKSDWFLNIQKNPHVTIQVGRRQTPALAERLSPPEAGEQLLNYARVHPAAMKNLLKFMGYRVNGSESDYRALGQYVPIVALHPQPA
jgi:deazaflavin-dependent oxidoreductase (nitroreductase family)